MAHPDLPATMTVEQAGALLGIGRGSAYRAAAAGDIPTIRVGRRILVPTALLHRMLGISQDALDAAAKTQQPGPNHRQAVRGGGAAGRQPDGQKAR